MEVGGSHAESCWGVLAQVAHVLMNADELERKESGSTSHNKVDEDLVKGLEVVGRRDFTAIFGRV